MRRPLWKIHILLTILILTGINIYLLMKLLRCADTKEELMEAGDVSAAAARESLSLKDDDGKNPEVPPEWPSSSMEENGGVGGGAVKLGRWDNSRRFLIRDYVWVGRQFYSTAVNQDVCLATQSSLDRIHSLTEMADHWRGAISIAVYLDGDEEVLLFRRIVQHLGRCHPDLFANIAFHLVSAPTQQIPSPAAASAGSSSTSTSATWPEDEGLPSGSRPLDPGSIRLNCSGPSTGLDWLLNGHPSLSAKWASTSRLYPQNLMRNIARKACPSQYVLLLDVDVIPSYNMAEAVAQFLDGPAVAHCLKCAFVVPTYELDVRAQFPQNKSQLLWLESQGMAQPFHQKAFRYNQFASNLTRYLTTSKRKIDSCPFRTLYIELYYPGIYIYVPLFIRWRQTPDTDDVIIHHNVTNYEFFYEPFYIARDDAPAHDERFLG